MDTEIQEQKSAETIPCDKCRYTDCSSLHDNVAPHCGLQTCKICPSVAELNEEISETHNKLIELIKQRRALKRQFNSHHERPIDRLPFELISKIFLLYFLDYGYPEFFFSYCNRPPVRIPLAVGAVCMSWRNVTLRIPQLWTVMKLTVRDGAPLYYFNVVQKWLLRSGSLPLSVVIYLQNSWAHPVRSHAMVALIRSHSARWSRIYIQSNHHSNIHKLLDNLNPMPDDLKFLSIEKCNNTGLQSFNSQSAVLLPRSISQIHAYNDAVRLWNLPCGFERLMDMDLESAPIDEVLHYIQHAPNLKKCKATSIVDFDSRNHSFSLPNIPIISRSVTHLEISTCLRILQYLTLPSLHTLDLGCHCRTSDDNDLNILATFLERSSPSLQMFGLTVRVWCDRISTWYDLFPAITSLRLEASTLTSTGPAVSESERAYINIADFLAALARTSPSVVLPNLECLSLRTVGMSPASWVSLCNIFQGYSEPVAAESLDQSDNSDMVQTTVGHKRLKEIEISLYGYNWKRYLSIEEMVFQRFENLKNAGIRLTVHAPYGPKFGETASV